MHVAILLRPYIRLILSGDKTVESRLTVRPLPPYEAIKPGERIYFKASAGPFMATAVAREVAFHDDLTPARVDELQRRHNAAVCGKESFWQRKRGARYATFITLRDAELIAAGPPIAPSRGPAWFVLDDDHPAPAVFDVTLSPGAVRNRYVRITRDMHRFDESVYGGRTAAQAGRPIELVLPAGSGSQVVRTDIVSNHMLRWRGWGALFAMWGAEAGDVLRFVQCAPGRYEVRFRRAAGTAPERSEV